jgi:rubrerythrin
MEQQTQSEEALVAELNDLLQLDHDAIQAYSLAIRQLQSAEYRRTLEGFRGDHQRHVDELTQLIHSRGGMPVQLPHLPSGLFKLAVQAAGFGRGDRAVLVAFKANERQAREKYRRAARGNHPADVTSVLARAADDEARHFEWVLDTLSELGWSEADAGRVERAVEVAHAGMADRLEGTERVAMEVGERARRTLTQRAQANPLGSALMALGAGVVIAALGGRRQ